MAGQVDATLEHLNYTVTDIEMTADMLARVFGWSRRWEGPAIAGGRSIHIGGDQSYIALYTPADGPGDAAIDKRLLGNLNHFGVTVADLDATEARVKSEGYHTYSHDDYEPGRRFYFKEDNGIEIEVVSYAD